MNIVHIASNAPYNDNWGYQDNLLPKYHAKMGHRVTMITTNLTHRDGQIVTTECADYVLSDGVRVIRLAHKSYVKRALTNIHARLDIAHLLQDLRPDFIFFHGLVSDNIYDAVAYKKKINPDCVIVQDNHLDYNIGRTMARWSDRVIRAYYRHVVRRNIKYVDRVYGVTPWRKTYAEDFFRVPKSKTDVLIMGADDEKIDFEHRMAIREKIRNEYGIAESDFWVITGGKIDERKKIHYLMRAVEGMERVRLLVFGQIKDDIKTEVDQIITQNDHIQYIGWIPSDRVYDYFLSADLVVFPGTHSVLWEQACASKIPCVFQRWEGMEHVNNGGNSDFLDEVSVDAIRNKLEALLYTDKYYEMKRIAESDNTDVYLYSHIAKKSLECATKI